MNECVITFNGTSFEDYHVYFNLAESLVIPENDVELVSVIGRNGDIIIPRYRFKNTNVSFQCYIKENFINNYIAFMNYLSTLNSYGRLETSLEPDVYRKAFFNGAVEPKIFNFDFGEFVLNFNCKPQKWLKVGEIPIQIENTKSLINPTSFESFPLIEVEGTGSIAINQSVLTLSANTSTTYIDCELQDAYEGNINRNRDLSVTGGFPVLAKENTITVTGFTSCKIYPRWWRL